MKVINENKVKLETNKIIIIVVGIFLLVTLLSCFATVNSGEVGLKVRFGKITKESISEGVNFKIPYIEKIVKVNIKVQKEELTVEGSTKDLQIVNTTIAVNYRIDTKKATYLYKNVGSNYEEVVLTPAIKESIKSAIAKYNAEEITTKRTEVSESCLKAIQGKVSKYGIIIEDFNLTDFSFSEEYTKAIEEKQVAEKNLEKAKLDAEAKVAKAKGEADANNLLQSTLSDQVLTEKFIEKWDGKLPETYAGDDVMSIFNLK